MEKPACIAFENVAECVVLGPLVRVDRWSVVLGWSTLCGRGPGRIRVYARMSVGVFA